MPFKHHLAEHRFSDNLIVKLTTEQGVVGFGEGVPRDFVTGETFANSFELLIERIAPALDEMIIGDIDEVIVALSKIIVPEYIELAPAMCCALELALLDAAGKTWKVPVVEFFKFNDRPHNYSAVIPMASPDIFNDMLSQARDAGMINIKIKVGDDGDLDRLSHARRFLGPKVDIRIDANGAWDTDAAIRRINAMAAYGISAVEQPVGKEDVDGIGRVAANTPVPLVVDESLCTITDAEKLAHLGNNIIFNLRLSKCGGMVASDRIYSLGQTAGIPCQLGCQVGETSILAAAGAHFAFSHELRYLEGAYSKFLLQEDIVTSPHCFGHAGKATPSFEPGLGIEVDEMALNRLAVLHHVIS